MDGKFHGQGALTWKAGHTYTGAIHSHSHSHSHQMFLLLVLSTAFHLDNVSMGEVYDKQVYLLTMSQI